MKGDNMDGLVTCKNSRTNEEYRAFDFYDAGIKIFSDKYHKKSGFLNCIICARDTSKKGESWGVVIGDGGGVAVHSQDLVKAETCGGYMGWFPIGSECIKKVPVEFRIKNFYEDKVRGV
jgi:hypothetical protein